MTRVFNDPSNFALEAVSGMATAYPQYVKAVHGGVVRATASPDGQRLASAVDYLSGKRKW